ncbi:MAG: Nif11-like leader peptide family natural product precursor [Chlorobiaceae bacterium]|nr:Nif11-like leader peptide family natural product precursor [Chlorobiaceae bacterium]
MTLEHAQSFIQRMKSERAFKVHVTSMEDIHERLEFINSEGYTCTEEEIKRAEIMAHSDVGQQRGGYWFVFSYISRYRL